MKYQYRWIYSVCLVFVTAVVGYLLDINYLLQDSTTLDETIKNISLKTRDESSEILQQPTQIASKDTELLSDFMHLLQENKLELTTATNADNALIHLIIQGEYENLQRFLLSLQQHASYTLQDFILTATSNSSIQADWLLRVNADGGQKNINEPSRKIINPFCNAKRGTQSVTQYKPDAARALGTVLQHGKRKTVLLFPDGSVIHQGQVS